MRLRLSAVAAALVVLAMVLTACGGGSGGRRGHSSSGGSSGGSYGDHDDDDDDDFDDLDDYDGLADSDYGTGTDDPTASESQLPASDDTIGAILPDLAALEGTVLTVRTSGAAGSEASLCGEHPAACATSQAQGQNGFSDEADRASVTFQVVAYPDEVHATSALSVTENDLGSATGYRETAALNEVGEGSIAYEVSEGGSPAAQIGLVRRGPYLGVVSHTTDAASDLAEWDLVVALSEMLDARMAQAAAGDIPTAAVDATALD